MRSWRGRLQTLSQPTACFLPDFGSPEALFLLIVSVELLAVVLALAPRQNWANFWIDLTNISFLCQSIALLSAGGLYYLRPWLGTLRTPHATLAIYGLTQAATILVTLLTLWPTILNAAGTISLTDQSFSLGRNLAISGIITLIALRYF
ncbi:MAG: hypothetical protein P9E88_00205, partial [Candidatus Competibacter sp.]|nr:hypothetical protein [Candidatus Competibacter sp.]